MAEEDPSQERRSDNFQRGRGYPNRSFSRYRGRGGRGRGDVQRTLHELGVTDLREHLNRKHHTDQSKSVPPSDPSYNFLRDPTREQTSPVSKSPSSQRPGRSKTQDTYIQNPLNIVVELTTQTGQRNYSIDDAPVLHSIKHVPDYPDERSRGSRSARARGRSRHNVEERAKSTERKYEDKTDEKGPSQMRSRSVEGRSDASSTRGRSSFRSRGHYRGRQRNTEYENVGRGSKTRGRGRGRSFRYRGDASNRKYQPSDDYREAQADPTEPEENWDEAADKECIKKQSNSEETDDPHTPEENEEPSNDAEEEEDTPEPEDPNKSSELENEPLLEDLQATIAKENLVVTSSDENENKNKKRTVRFKENEGAGEEQSDDVKG
ncbi:unnamed protein product [Phyllotreta striolata]|uniref:Uncharacterized protein n=1 Tax=Phyllotreta striolata TaxID=444603 RepID=A0A9N9U1C1_PHYSR|nr:unnamed protein product [Phyllotreta striolata]